MVIAVAKIPLVQKVRNGVWIQCVKSVVGVCWRFALEYVEAAQSENDAVGFGGERE